MAPLSNDDLPVKVLRYNTRKTLSDLLNGIKIFKSDENLCRDWRGLAFLCGITVSSHRQDRDPTEDILLKWQQKEDATIKQLLQFLEKLDRFDIIADTEVMICEDVEVYLREPVPQLSMQLALNSSAEQQLITIDDIDRKSRGLEPQIYDAIILYADNDREVALQLLQQLENDNFKLCFKDRDIVPGVNFEHEAFMTLIRERCNKVIIILSPDFLQCPFNGFLHLFAQAVSIDERKRKVIPCIYKFQSREQMPTEFKFYTMLRYDDMNRWPEIFWNRLKTSIAAAKIDYPTNSSVRIKELPSNTTKELKSIMPSSKAISQTNTIEIKMNEIVPEMKCKEKTAVTSHKETFCKVNDDIICKSLEQNDTCDCDNILNEKVENKPQKYSSFKKFLKTITRSKSKESRKKCLLAS